VSQFLDVLLPAPLGDGVQWAHMQPFRYQSDILRALALATHPDGLVEILPHEMGSVTDFGSIPKPLQNIYPVWSRAGAGYCVHDALYFWQTTTREVADNILREAMIVLGVDGVTVNAIYNGVRLFGQAAWDHNAALKANGYQKRVPLGESNPPYAGVPI